MKLHNQMWEEEERIKEKEEIGFFSLSFFSHRMAVGRVLLPHRYDC